MKNEFKILTVKVMLADRKGIKFGYIEYDPYRLFLEHWTDKNQYYTQWGIFNKHKNYRNIGSAHVAKEKITVINNKRDKTLKEYIKNRFPDLDSNQIDLFFSEIVELANQLKDNLFPIFKNPFSDEIEEEEEDKTENWFNEYSTDVKEEANRIFEDDPLEYFLETLDLEHYGDSENKEILVLVMFSKHVKNGKQVSTIITGTTESGKTSLAKKTAKLAPERFLIETNSMSSKAAFYHQDAFRDDCNHLIINDFLDSPEAIATLKALTDTEIDVVRHMTVSDDKEARTLEVTGKNTVIVTAARQLTDRELNRRLLHLNPDESSEHQQKTKKFIINGEAGINENNDRNIEIAQAVYEKIIEEEYEVMVPWVFSLDVERFSKTDIKHFTNLVKARAIIYRSQRSAIIDNVILASIEDIKEVERLWVYIGKMQRTYLPSKAYEMLDILPIWDEDVFNESGDVHYGTQISDITKNFNVGRNTVKGWLWGEGDQRGLIDLGDVHAVKDGTARTSPWILYRNSTKVPKDDLKDEEASSVRDSEISKHLLGTIDKQKVFCSICRLFINEGSYSDSNIQQLTELVSQKFTKDIETDQDILEICKLVKEELESSHSE